MFRVGSGHDTHRLADGYPLILGGVKIDHPQGLVGHSDADAVLHAVTDALLGALALGDIGDAFPDTDPQWKGADSRLFLRAALDHVNRLGWKVVNLDVTVFAQRPKLGPVKANMRANLAELLGLPPDCVNVKAKTGESVGHIGRGEAIGCHAVVLIQRPHPPSPSPRGEGVFNPPMFPASGDGTDNLNVLNTPSPLGEGAGG